MLEGCREHLFWVTISRHGSSRSGQVQTGGAAARLCNRLVIEGIIYWYGCGITWRDLSAEFSRGRRSGCVTAVRLRRDVGPDPRKASGGSRRRRPDRQDSFGGLDHQIWPTRTGRSFSATQGNSRTTRNCLLNRPTTPFSRTRDGLASKSIPSRDGKASRMAIILGP